MSSNETCLIEGIYGKFPKFPTFLGRTFRLPPISKFVNWQSTLLSVSPPHPPPGLLPCFTVVGWVVCFTLYYHPPTGLSNEYFSILIYECPRHTGFLGGVVYIRWATQKPAHPPAPPPHPYFLPCFTLFYFLPCFTLFLHLPYITAFYFLPYIFTGGFLLGGVTGEEHYVYSFYPVFYCFTWCLLVLFYATNFLLFTLYYRDF